ncbi:MAG: bis(5'-nucleosyl)-tetraphosphatase (symmetrical) YqeK [Bacteroidota bacterium]
MIGGSESKIREEAARSLSPERWRHTLGVAATAEELALIHGADPDLARVAGLLHDYAREMAPEELQRLATAKGLEIDPIEAREPLLLHGKVGAMLAYERFGLAHPDLLAAIAQHITGAPGMTLLASVVFLADFIEPGRRDDVCAHARSAARSDLRRALLLALDATMHYVITRGYFLHPRSVAARNELLDPGMQ